MKINKTKNEKFFSDIPLGGIFRFADDFFIKIEQMEIDYGDINGIKLETGQTAYFSDNKKVEFYPNAELTL